MTPLLQLAQEAFCRQFALEVLDGSLDPFAVNDDLQGLALYGFAGIRQGTGNLSDNVLKCKSRIDLAIRPVAEESDEGGGLGACTRREALGGLTVGLEPSNRCRQQAVRQQAPDELSSADHSRR